MRAQKATPIEPGLSAVVEVGTILKRVREQKGLSRADAAKELHFTKERLTDIEENNWSQLPETVFVKGYLKSYAKLLGLNVEEITELYKESTPVNPIKRMGWLGSSIAARPTNLSELWFKTLALSLIILGGTMVLIWWYGNKQQSVSLNHSQALQRIGETIESQ